MNSHDRSTGATHSPIAAAIYYLIFILLLPVFLLGYVIWVIQVFGLRKSSASATAQAPLFGRWLQHQMGTRQDEVTDRLWRKASSVPSLAWRLVAGPMLFAHRVSGYVPKNSRYPFEGEITIQNQGWARQTFYDDLVRQHIPGMPQFVILGAGFDTRALNLPKDTPVRSFEVDTPATIAEKREMLAKAGIDTTGVVFAAADFEKEDWLTKLVGAGFDPDKPTLFIWEGVTPYLTREAVEDTLRKIASTAKGSIVAFDHFTSEVLESDALLMRSIRASLNAGGEPLKFGIDSTPPLRKQVEEMIQSCGLALIEQRTLGEEQDGKRAWGGVAVAEVK